MNIHTHLPARPSSYSINRNNHNRDKDDFYVVMALNIPVNTKIRPLRKAIGRATYGIQSHPRINFSIDLARSQGPYTTAKITFATTESAKLFVERYGARDSDLYIVMVNQKRLAFRKSTEPVEEYRLRAIQNMDPDEYDSDFDEEGDGEDHSQILKLSAMECGGFDDEGRYCVGWSRTAQTPRSYISYDIDEARLRIHCDTYVIQAMIYDIKVIYAGEGKRRLYFEFKQPQLFLRDDITETHAKDSLAWLDAAPSSFSRSHERFKRVAAFDDDHARCVQYGTVYRVLLCQQNPNRFFLSTKDRLNIYKTVKEEPDASKDAFDCTSVDRMLEKLDFLVAFQAQALLGVNKLLPCDLISLRGELMGLQKQLGAKEAAEVVRNLKSDLKARGPLAKHEGWPSFTMKQVRERLANARTPSAALMAPANIKEKYMVIHSAFVTPSHGLKLEGPHPDEGNRILRSYSGKDEHFIRVHFIEEDGSSFRVVQDYGCVDAEDMMYDRFGIALRKGIMVGGRKYRFLAFSGSSLREHSCWFVRSFKWNGEKITAETIRDSIGELKHLRSPARYAARMGQAFTATTTSVNVNASAVKVVEDLKSTDAKYEFSDGVGTMSKEVCDRINEAIYNDSTEIPTVTPSTFQIRMGGAKGMLCLDARLKGEQVILRKSMVKFESKPINGCFSLEIAGYYPKPVPMFLNRPMIALLESWGVRPEVFLELQHESVKSLQESTTRPEAAIQLLHRTGVGRGCNMEGIIRSLDSNGINVITQVPFLHDANISLVNFALRNIKYRARIRVPKCHTLVGVMDETGTLAENQVIACINEPGKEVYYLKGRCLLGRSPMLAPGDVQYATAVAPPTGHPLRAITNAVIFSQKGVRPLASKLSGGDLDGDLYNIIQHEGLMGMYSSDAADYAKNTLKELKRDCTIEDVVDFFLDYIKMDKLGLIATRHLEIGDRYKEGVMHPDCLKLAAMHSVAVDFPKSGLLPEIREMPRAPREKPDFRKPEFRNEDRSENMVKKHPRNKDIYYTSEKALGKMFRGINVHKQTQEWAEKAREHHEKWTDVLWEVLMQKNRGAGKWKQLVKVQKRLVDEYYARVGVIAQEHCPDEKGARLPEEEVFMGHIICRGPNGSRLSRFDITKRLQDDFLFLCQDIRKRALFDLVALSDLSRLCKSKVWQWVMTLAGQRLSMSDVMQVELDPEEDLHLIARQLRVVIERGLAWTKAALDMDEERGRSAPWIVVPVVLQTHACLDIVEAYLQRQGTATPEDASGQESQEEDGGELSTPSTSATSLSIQDHGEVVEAK
jgi:hypothetical protein